MTFPASETDLEQRKMTRGSLPFSWHTQNNFPTKNKQNLHWYQLPHVNVVQTNCDTFKIQYRSDHTYSIIELLSICRICFGQRKVTTPKMFRRGARPLGDLGSCISTYRGLDLSTFFLSGHARFLHILLEGMCFLLVAQDNHIF